MIENECHSKLKMIDLTILFIFAFKIPMLTFLAIDFMKTARPEPGQFPFVVPIVYKRKYPAATICSGSILTEKLVLSAAYPIAIMPLDYYCVLPGYLRLDDVTASDIEQNCIGIEKTHLTPQWTPKVTSLNLAIVELEKKIIFSWHVSTSPIIYPKKLENFTIGSSCVAVGWMYRPAINIPGFPLTRIALQTESVSVLVDRSKNVYNHIWPNNASKFDFCSANLGMPVVCNCTMIGVIATDNLKGDIKCDSYKYHSIVNIMSSEVQRFLKMIIPDSFDERLAAIDFF